MAYRDGGGNSPLVRECGDAPHVTRLVNGVEITRDTRFSSWSSPEKFCAHLKTINPRDIWYGEGNAWGRIDTDFCGVENIEEAFDLCYNGWKEGGETIEKTRSYIHALNPTLPKPIKYAIAGSTPNVPRAVAGNILNMRAPEETKASKRKIITILYNMCENWCVDKNSITNKAAAMAALIDVIEEKGFSCEVICVSKTTGGMHDYLSIMVKESHHAVDTNRLAFCLGHAAMFRVLCFADWESDPFCKPLGRGLGCATSTKPSHALTEKHIYTITSANGKSSKFKDMDTAAKEGVQALIEELQQQGCPAFKKGHVDDLDKCKEDEELHPDDEDFYDDYDDYDDFDDFD